MIMDELGKLRLTARKVNQMLENPGVAGARFGAMHLLTTRVAIVKADIITSGTIPSGVSANAALLTTGTIPAGVSADAALLTTGSVNPARITSGGAFSQTPGYADPIAEADMTALITALNASGVLN